MRIEAGDAIFGKDITEKNLPQEIGRDARAINFVKGCYLGQETVAQLEMRIRPRQSDLARAGVRAGCRHRRSLGPIWKAKGRTSGWWEHDLLHSSPCGMHRWRWRSFAPAIWPRERSW